MPINAPQGTKKTLETYRFDYYDSTDNPVSWKPDVDLLAEFDINFDATTIETIIEKKPHDVRDEDGTKRKIDCWYYPGCVFKFSIVRDPQPKYLKVFFPSLILGAFLIGCFNLEVDQLADRLANLSIVLLAYIATMGELRSDMP